MQLTTKQVRLGRYLIGGFLSILSTAIVGIGKYGLEQQHQTLLLQRQNEITSTRHEEALKSLHDDMQVIKQLLLNRNLPKVR